ncbi:hypothetical protein, conserved [Babesia bigemina]|uniref:Uncharacterized protein n=1 Tax=Babesia bigemina TaxID=5866 RepID=A0A061D672_BABBI|nr:hypothetical protein, conserved [Babesia bigemina]CDR94424.1 hypothetical protein, conserved [Babesia bigemina]|eukprot:XP_012766610.1 hypothetical protein, conserved [Babesia bigemina]
MPSEVDSKAATPATKMPGAKEAAAQQDADGGETGYREYAVLDLHLNQFLSFIAEDYSFLPCAIYKPRIDVYLDGKLMYKSRVLAHEDDIFGNVIRLRVYSPNSLLTLKLYECVQLRLTEKSVDELIRPMLRNEPTDEVLISWCNIELSLLVPAQRYDMVCAFRVNPMFVHYNPGGILYYPTVNGKPFIENKRVCCACRVCVFLASNTLTVHEKVLNKYFDFRCDPHEAPLPWPANSKDQGAASMSDSDGGKGGTNYARPVGRKELDPDKKYKNESETVVKMMREKNYTKEKPVYDIHQEDSKLETFEMNVKKIFFTQENCTCCRLVDVPKQLRGINYSPCPCCHDYQVCCEHSLETYYYTSISLKLVSKTPIDFKTELMALMNVPPGRSKDTHERNDSLCSIVTRVFELRAQLTMLNCHLGFSSGREAHQQYFYVFVAIIMLGFILDGKTLTVSCFLLGFITMYLHNTSLKQYQHDFGDVIEASRRLTQSGEGLEKTIREMVEEEEPVSAVEPEDRHQRNMKCVSKHDFIDDVKLFSKLNTSLNRKENISIKTMALLLSSSIPKSLRSTLVTTVEYCESFVWCVNAVLAAIRRFGPHLCCFFCSMGFLSLRYAFWMKCCIKAVLILCCTSALVEEHSVVRRRFSQLRQVAKYLAMRIYRNEWFLNANSFP